MVVTILNHSLPPLSRHLQPLPLVLEGAALWHLRSHRKAQLQLQEVVRLVERKAYHTTTLLLRMHSQVRESAGLTTGARQLAVLFCQEPNMSPCFGALVRPRDGPVLPRLPSALARLMFFPSMSQTCQLSLISLRKWLHSSTLQTWAVYRHKLGLPPSPTGTAKAHPWESHGFSNSSRPALDNAKSISSPSITTQTQIYQPSRTMSRMSSRQLRPKESVKYG